VDNTQTGRINKAVIAAVKSQILLFHASPLFNGNTALAGFKNPDGAALFNQTYDKERWKAAADAALAVIQMSRFQLFKVTDPNPFTAGFLSYRNLFFEGYSKAGPTPQTGNGNVTALHALPMAMPGMGLPCRRRVWMFSAWQMGRQLQTLPALIQKPVIQQQVIFTT
jgi:hypothetical protein